MRNRIEKKGGGWGGGWGANAKNIFTSGGNIEKDRKTFHKELRNVMMIHPYLILI